MRLQNSMNRFSSPENFQVSAFLFYFCFSFLFLLFYSISAFFLFMKMVDFFHLFVNSFSDFLITCLVHTIYLNEQRAHRERSERESAFCRRRLCSSDCRKTIRQTRRNSVSPVSGCVPNRYHFLFLRIHLLDETVLLTFYCA